MTNRQVPQSSFLHRFDTAIRLGDPIALHQSLDQLKRISSTNNTFHQDEQQSIGESSLGSIGHLCTRALHRLCYNVALKDAPTLCTMVQVLLDSGLTDMYTTVFSPGDWSNSSSSALTPLEQATFHYQPVDTCNDSAIVLCQRLDELRTRVEQASREVSSLILRRHLTGLDTHRRAFWPLHHFLSELAYPNVPSVSNSGAEPCYRLSDWVIVGDLGITHGSLVLACLREWLESHREMALSVDSSGCFPLHVACSRAPDLRCHYYAHTFHNEIVQLLVQACPEALTAGNYRGEFPVQLLAARHEASLDTIYWLLCQAPHVLRHA